MIKKEATQLKSVGRPRQHIDSAARQRAYRLRQAAAGLREVGVWVRDVRAGVELHSDIIDLSAVPEWRR